MRPEFAELAGFELPPRRSNRLQDRVLRRDTVFASLARLGFDRPQALEPLEQWCRGRTEAQAGDPLGWELLGYVLYCREQWREAAGAFMTALELDPENVDTWLDLGFALGHLGVSAGSAILFDHLRFIEGFLAVRPARCTLFTLERLRRAIEEDGSGLRDRAAGVVERYRPVLEE